MTPTLTIYKASAGSGKTFTLAVEYIALLLASAQGSAFRNTLAVTFTNKATAEMKDRILQQLYAIAHDLPEGQSYMQAACRLLEGRGLYLPQELIRTRAGEALSCILHDFNYFRVETIDSFFQSVMRTLAHELGLPPNLEVELNTVDTVARAVDLVIDNLQFHPQIQQWVLSYVTEQIEQGERWDVTRTVKDFARCIFEEDFQNRTPEQRARMDDEARIQQFRRQMDEVEREAREQVANAARALDEEMQRPPLDYDRISRGNYYQQALQRMIDGCFDPDAKTLPSAAADPEKMLRAKDKRDPEMLRLATERADAIGRLLHLYEDEEGRASSARLARRHINPMRLLGCIEEAVNALCNEKNQIMLSQTPTLLSSLVEGSDAPFVFEKIGTQFHHVMIDEFQDTSLLQWKNFRVLLLENQSQGGHDLLVGDVKQSIYRWRNGDWSILAGIQNEMSRLSPQVRTLNTNYRSSSQVVDFNNAFFPKAAALLDSLASGARFRLADIYEDVRQVCHRADREGYVSVRLYARQGVGRPEGYDENMVDDMAARIRQLLARGVGLADMAILVRTRRMGTRLIELFSQRAPDILLVSDEAYLLQSSVAVNMIVCALQTLDDPLQANPVPLHYLVEHYLHDVLHAPATPADFAPRAMEERLPAGFLDRRDELSRLPLMLLCERIYRIFGLSAIEGQDTYLCAFHDELQSYLSSHPSDIHSFLQAWDEQIASRSIPCGHVAGLQVMTIHQSKGLQFHTVLLPCTEWDIENDRRSELLWCTPQEPPFGELGLLPVTPGKQMAGSVFAPWYEEEHLQKRVDSLNTLYVAFTRAESNLMIWGLTSQTFTSRALSGDLLFSCLDFMPGDDGSLFYEQGSPAGKQAAQDHPRGSRMSPVPETIPLRVDSFEPHLDFRQSNESARFIRSLDEEGEQQEQTYLELGKIMHHVLSQVNDLNDVEQVVDHCLRQGLIADSTQRAAILERIRRGMDNPLVASWFAPGQEVYNECDITLIHPETGLPEIRRPDRVVVQGDHITVVDFKFGRACPEHEAQVAEYMHLLRRMYPAKSVSGYLWYVYSGRTLSVQ